MESIWTAVTTVLIGVVIYAISQVVTKFIIEPVYEQRQAIGEVIDALVFYGLIYLNKSSFDREKHDEVANALRLKGSNLRVKSYAIPYYETLAWFNIVKSLKEINSVCKSLNVICFLIYDKDNQVKMKNKDSSLLIYEESNKIFNTLKFPSLNEE